MLSRETFKTTDREEIEKLIIAALDASRQSWCVPNPLPKSSEEGLDNVKNMEITKRLINVIGDLLSRRENLEMLLGKELQSLDKDFIIRALVATKGKLIWAKSEGFDIETVGFVGNVFLETIQGLRFPDEKTEAKAA